MRLTVIGGTGLIGSQVVQRLTRSRTRGRPRGTVHRRRPDHGRWSGPGAGGRRGRGQPGELADIRRGVPGLLPHHHEQPAGRGRARRCPAPGDPLDRRRGPGAPAGLLPCQDPAGGPAPPGAHAVLHRACHPVLRVHGHRLVLDLRRHRRSPARYPPSADRRRGRRRRGRRGRPGTPLQGIRKIAGPDVFPLDELGRVTLAAKQDNRTVITDDKAGMFAAVTGDVLTAGPDAHLAPTHYQDWIQTSRHRQSAE